MSIKNLIGRYISREKFYGYNGVTLLYNTRADASNFV